MDAAELLRKSMKASVIIPTKNPGEHFHRVLDAVLRQTTDFAFEVLVIDSGSTDGTVEYVQQMREPRLHLHTIPPASYGHGKTRNLAISLTQGEYAVLITHDALPAHTGWLAAMVAAADADPAIAGVFGRHLAYPSANPFTAHELVVHFEGFNRTPVVWKADAERYCKDMGYRQFLHFFSDNNALVRRSVWDVCPYPDVDFAEDQIWAQRIIEAGYKKAYAHEGTVFHSHDYSLVERLQRSFDESFAFEKLFGYVLCPSIWTALRSATGITRRDLRHAREKGLWRTHSLRVLRAPFDNLMRTLGHYLGAKGSTLPPKLRKMLSWDHRLLVGLRSSQSHSDTL
jgi:rhamnosyltransferase